MARITPCDRTHPLGILFGCLWALGLLIGPAAAADYKLAYAIDMQGKKITGTLEQCLFNRVCQRHVGELDVTLSAISRRSNDRDVTFYIHGRSGCCYFFGGSSTARVDSRTRISTLAVYEGRGRQRNEFVPNRRIGTIYVGFAY